MGCGRCVWGRRCVWGVVGVYGVGGVCVGCCRCVWDGIGGVVKKVFEPREVQQILSEIL